MCKKEISVRGSEADAETRCRHYHSERDRIAIKFYCCGEYYSCHSCHEELADHEAEVWPAGKFDENAVLCGACRNELTVHDYLSCHSICPSCSAQFNPGCSLHKHLYFEVH
ncbi:hypothetical protein GKZ89_15200 [Bacillus mangrovi]|uniref:CHY-type domain-containing protein n=1 Tax=Metabacillus mangrovi TaxID=1491830 RepID=A0A7X2V609_9BACI|nr:CHY zinc finger protein [Metabacillus mangrovi]MTH54749.1 hypothetical protein [Metabacillus mangrovi]